MKPILLWSKMAIHRCVGGRKIETDPKIYPIALRCSLLCAGLSISAGLKQNGYSFIQLLLNMGMIRPVHDMLFCTIILQPEK